MTTAQPLVKSTAKREWYLQSAEAVLAQLGSSASGLSLAEAAQRLATDGPYELKEGPRISLLRIFLSQFKSLIIWILIAAGVISGVLGDMVDTIAILAIVILNAVIGFYQEFNEAGADKGTPLQQKLDAVGRILVWVALGIVALLFGLGLLRGTKLFELFMTSISLAVAAVPEGLPTVVTVALSLGVLRMARRRALVRKLAAVETLGSTSIICTDNTGILTVGEMPAYSSGQYT